MYSFVKGRILGVIGDIGIIIIIGEIGDIGIIIIIGEIGDIGIIGSIGGMENRNEKSRLYEPALAYT